MNSSIDGVIGYSDSSTDITFWNSMAILVRMFTNGRFEARDGNTYAADTDVDYSANMEYHVRIKVDMLEQIYDVWVTPEGEDEVKIADDYEFRSDAPETDDIGHICLKGSVGMNFKLQNHIIK